MNWTALTAGIAAGGTTAGTPGDSGVNTFYPLITSGGAGGGTHGSIERRQYPPVRVTGRTAAGREDAGPIR